MINKKKIFGKLRILTEYIAYWKVSIKYILIKNKPFTIHISVKMYSSPWWIKIKKYFLLIA